jgi:uncharacterized membrane protein YeiH
VHPFGGHATRFVLPIWFDLSATLLFAVTGAWIGVRKGYDSVGVFVLALVAGVGGGLMRDVVFIAQGPPAAVQDSRYLGAVVLGAAVGVVSFRRGPHFQRLFAAVDALGLGVYAVVGAQKALDVGLQPLAALIAGVTNATGGGILRDLLVGSEPLVFQPGQFYVLAALAGCSAFVVMRVYLDVWVEPASLAAIVVTFALRLLAIRFNWRTRAAAQRWGPRTTTLDDGLIETTESDEG